MEHLMAAYLMDMLMAVSLAVGGYAGKAGVAELLDDSTLTLPVAGTSQSSGRFIVSGDQPVLVVVRGLGPSLRDLEGFVRHNVIKDPRLELRFADGTLIAANDDWRYDADAVWIPADLRPGHPVEAAVARHLAPGEYAVVLADKSGRARRAKTGAVTVTRVDAAPAHACADVAAVCHTVTSNGHSVACSLPVSTCGFALDLLVEQIAGLGYPVTASTPMLLQAWGGSGGRPMHGGMGGAAGYAQTATSVADIVSRFGTTRLHYVLGEDGAQAGNACGAGGGTATIVTAQEASPGMGRRFTDVLLIAGGGGGSSHAGEGPCGFSGSAPSTAECPSGSGCIQIRFDLTQ